MDNSKGSGGTDRQKSKCRPSTYENRTFENKRTLRQETCASEGCFKFRAEESRQTEKSKINMNYQESIAQAEREIKKLQIELAEMKRIRREDLKAEARKNRKKPGRKPLDKELIEIAREKAKTKSLTDVALSLGISIRSLYNKGISRASIEAEKTKKATENCTESTPTMPRHHIKKHRRRAENERNFFRK